MQTVTVLSPLHEDGILYKVGEKLALTDERAHRLWELRLVVLDPIEVVPPDPKSELPEQPSNGDHEHAAADVAGEPDGPETPDRETDREEVPESVATQKTQVKRKPRKRPKDRAMPSPKSGR